jgi:plastocyanin
MEVDISSRRSPLLALLVLALLALVVPHAHAAAEQPPIDPGKLAKGAKRMMFKFGPIHITPGQNTIEIKPNFERPKVPGYITRFKPDLIRADGTTPRVDILHLHHGVWLIDGKPTFAAGEEKSIVSSPPGFGLKYTPKQAWAMNYMVHNLITSPDTVYLTYEIDFIPMGRPEAKRITPVTTQWLDAEGGKAYPVFDAKREQANARGRMTYPDDVPDAYAGGPPRNEWTADRDLTIVQTVGHLHPGGLETFLTARRGNRTVRLFSSKAHYWEPAGAVSWDAAMTATPRTWKVAIRQGDVLAVHGTYDVARASWYESMAIMPLAVTAKPAGGLDPFVASTDRPGVITHGHLPENDVHGGGPPTLPDMTKVLDGPVSDTRVTISSFVYGQGSMSLSGMPGRPPVVRKGTSVKFFNADARKSRNIFHTITACKSPCNKTTGIAYPLADGPVDFDSGELGFGPRNFTAAANVAEWDTPKDLPSGTYTYFCRVHPFMRGAFRVKD